MQSPFLTTPRTMWLDVGCNTALQHCNRPRSISVRASLFGYSNQAEIRGIKDSALCCTQYTFSTQLPAAFLSVDVFSLVFNKSNTPRSSMQLQGLFRAAVSRGATRLSLSPVPSYERTNPWQKHRHHPCCKLLGVRTLRTGGTTVVNDSHVSVNWPQSIHAPQDWWARRLSRGSIESNESSPYADQENPATKFTRFPSLMRTPSCQRTRLPKLST
jgi:hypothetical protein